MIREEKIMIVIFLENREKMKNYDIKFVIFREELDLQ